ncbi:MAG: FAD-dependent oxidoreductase [Thermodesulfobacteriota bacterium]|jgi:fumarate reductase flavoprotein subunit
MNEPRTETDIVVIGSGASGLAAAVTAAEEGVRVTLFEKQASLGGTSNFFNGMFAVESAMQAEQYITYSRDQAFRNIMEYSHWRTNGALVRVFVDKSADTIRWLQDYGVGFPQVTINMPDAPRTYHIIKGGGEAVVKALASRAKEKGVSIRLGTPIKRILKDSTRIVGVVAEVDGEDIQVACQAVIIASGGYANNKEWIKKYTGLDLGDTVFSVGNVDKMGDGIRMAWEMGAGAEGMGVLQILRAGPFGPEFPFMNVVEAAAIQPILWVNHLGERFCDEGIAYYDTSAGNANARYKKGYTFCVFDDSIKKRFMEKGISHSVAQVYLPGYRLASLDEELQRQLAQNTAELFVADSIDVLAEKTGVNPSVLKATVAQYNGFCEKGHDDLFAKDPQYLIPLKGPRFYAVKARTVFIGTLGGIRINRKTEAVDQYDVAIPGLYAVGNDAGGVHAGSYCMRDSSGASSAFAVNSGRMAGENAARYLKG